MTTIRTERLTLRPMVPADAQDYAAMRYHPEVAKWLMARPDDHAAAARRAIGDFATAWQSRRYAPWGVFLEGRLIGHCGLNLVPEYDRIEVLWALHPDSWGKGYATESARAALRYGFETLGLESIFAITRLHNLASQAVVERLGLIWRRNVMHRGIEVRWFDIDRADWAG